MDIKSNKHFLCAKINQLSMALILALGGYTPVMAVMVNVINKDYVIDNGGEYYTLGGDFSDYINLQITNGSILHSSSGGKDEAWDLGNNVDYDSPDWWFATAQGTVISGVGSLLEISGKTYGTVVSNGGKELMTTVVSGFFDGDNFDQITPSEAHGTTVNAGGIQQIFLGAKSYGTVVNDGGQQYVLETRSDGLNSTAYGTTINAGGKQYAYLNGVARDTIVAGGIQYIQQAGTSYNTMISDGGKQYVRNDGLSEGTKVNNGGTQYVYSSASGQGHAKDTVINAGGKQYVYNQGSAKGTLINVGGIQYVQDLGSTAEEISVNGGTLSVHTQGHANTINVTNNGVVRITTGGTVSGDLSVIGQGTLAINSGLFADQVKVLDAGRLTVDSLATASSGINRIVRMNALLNEGTTVFGSADSMGFLNLETKHLSGYGTFVMRVAGMQGDFLNVTESVSGQHVAKVIDSGRELRSGSSDGYHLIHAAGSSAQSFSLPNGVVDLGAYQYQLAQNGVSGDDWYLVRLGAVAPGPNPNPNPEQPINPNKPMVPWGLPSATTLSNSAHAVIAMANVAPSIWDGELSTLRSRLGEMHDQTRPTSGVWGKYINNRYAIAQGVAYKQDLQGFMFGGDHAFDQTNGKLMLGGLVSYSRSDIKYQRGGKGTADSFGLGLYGTYLWDNGFYLDGVVKVNRFNMKTEAQTLSGHKPTGKNHFNGVGGSLELGKHIKWAHYFVEPYIMASYFRSSGSAYRLSNDLQANVLAGQSLSAEIGGVVGALFTLKNGAEIRPYMRLALSHEFEKNNGLTINHTERFNTDFSGTRLKYGLGVTAKLSDRWSLYAEVNYAKSTRLEMPYSGQLGVRFSF